MKDNHNYTAENVNSELTATETITQLARRHLQDKSHTTTDEELRNAKIELSEIVTVSTKKFFTMKNFITNNRI